MLNMEPRYRVGEKMGPYIVESVEWIDNHDGTFLEKIINSGRSVFQVLHRPPEPPRLFLLPPTTDQTRVVIPYVPNYKHADLRHPLTVAAAPMTAHWVDVSGSTWNYWSLLRNAWDPNHDLFLIEHDVEAREDAVAEMESCPELWCFSQYHHFSPEDAEAWHWGILGFTRFRSQLISALPRLIVDLDVRWRDWHEMSTGIGMKLREAGYAPHVHEPPVFHHRMDVTRGA